MSSVYLVRHIASKQIHILKQVAKQHPMYLQLRREAEILQMLSIEGVPRIVALEEDATYFYLVETFLEGENLEYFRWAHGCSVQTAIVFGIQICEMVELLHTNYPKPILYLDFKPEHFILQGTRLGMIDFGNACTCEEELTHMGAGTPGFRAPELRAQQTIDERTDIYGIAATIFYCITGIRSEDALRNYVNNSALPRPLKSILLQGVAPTGSQRQKSVSELKAQLLSLQPQKNGGLRKIRRIAVVASRPGVGATHLAISLTSYFNYLGQAAVYIPHAATQVLPSLKQNVMGMVQRGALYQYLHFCGRPPYGQTKRSTGEREAIEVLDVHGSDSQAQEIIRAADLVLLVADVRVWETPPIAKLLEHKTCGKGLIVLHASSKEAAQWFSKKYQVRAARFPTDRDAFQMTDEKLAFFTAILSGKEEGIKEPDA